MCLAVPGEIVAIEDGEPRHARVAFGAVERRVCLSLVPEAQVGDYVIVHVGFAISRLDPEQAHLTLATLNEVESSQGTDDS
ncbi:MAG TPA: HypC/HybG/HupF family hydrogenase formation chaperone [Polyangiaceae bacterium]|nr:HypC/HybG/HupF family hydrogenase formation chaperone [Polyangiaceae bacterium]